MTSQLPQALDIAALFALRLLHGLLYLCQWRRARRPFCKGVVELVAEAMVRNGVYRDFGNGQ